MTIRTSASLTASRSSSKGKGRHSRSRICPTSIPSARISSMATEAVSPTLPIVSSRILAPSLWYFSTGQYCRPKVLPNSFQHSTITSLEFLIATSCAHLVSVKINGGAKSPIATGLSGFSGSGKLNGGRNLSTALCSGNVIGSMTWVRLKPSRCTIAGSSTRLSSAMRKAHIILSTVCWPFSATICIQPVSRTDIISEWSHQILSGDDNARLATAITMGNRIGAAT